MKTRWDGAVIVFVSAKALLCRFIERVCGEYEAQQARAVVVLGMPDAAPNLPIHVLALPGSRPHQHDRDGRVPQVLVPNPLADGLGPQVRVYVSHAYRARDKADARLLFKQVAVVLVFSMVVADKHLVHGTGSLLGVAPSIITSHYSSPLPKEESPYLAADYAPPSFGTRVK